MTKTYLNPLYPGYFADPFVLLHDGRFWAYGTGPGSADGAAFPMLQSDDMVHWQPAGWAVTNAPGIEHWAPEVAYADGQFYLYYSARGVDGRDHQLRVATSATPAGPFMDSGRVLTPEQPFAIDAHPYQHADGQWYLYYACDFLTLDEHYRVGTGIVVDRLVDMVTLAGQPQIVVRPFADWHLFKAQREMYGAVYDWHTVEGPAVRVHNGRIYCFYSGGAWERENYGLSYVTAAHPLGPYSAPEESAPLLQSIPGQVIGPGHNSFVTAPDGATEYCIYHAWDVGMTARRLCADRLVWEGDRPVILGPTTTAQPLVGFQR